MSEYIPSTSAWVANQVELYESSGGTQGNTLMDTGMPVIIVTNRGHKTGAIRKTPLMRVADGENYILVASKGGAPEHPAWYYNLQADPNVEIRDKTDSDQDAGARGRRSGRARAGVDDRGRSLPELSELPGQHRPPHSRLHRRTGRVTSRPSGV